MYKEQQSTGCNVWSRTMSMWAEIHKQVKTEMMELGYTVISMLPASFQRRSIVIQMFLCLQTFVGFAII
jgi:hypothetical protein